MKRKRFNEVQIIAVLKENEAGAKIDDFCRRQGIDPTAYFAWRRKHGGMDASEAKRKAVGFLMSEMGLSERRSCRLVGLARSVQQYRRQPRNDDAVVERLKDLASQNRRYGYPHLHDLLRREGLAVNHRRTFGSILSKAIRYAPISAESCPVLIGSSRQCQNTRCKGGLWIS